MSIMDYFPKSKKPRQVQVDTLLAVEANWDKAEVFVLNLPVASGKSLVAYTIAKWSSRDGEKSPILVPNKLLNEQYKNEFKSLKTLRGKSSYLCYQGHGDGIMGSKFNDKRTCADTCAVSKQHCMGCPYVRARNSAKSATMGVYNYHVYMAHKLAASTLLIDEAHMLLPFIRSLNSIKMWQHQVHYPTYIESYGDLTKWINGLQGTQRNAVEEFRKFLLENGKPTHIVQAGEDLYHGSQYPCLKLMPVDTSGCKQFLWSKFTKKIVLLSSTIGTKDVQQMGLSNKRIMVINGDNAIDKERRPIYYDPIANMSHKKQEESVPELAQFFTEKLPELQGKGLIHAPYSLITKIKVALPYNSRYLFHGKEDKGAVFEKFKASEGDEILFASGMEEGIDLPYEAARWQFITKVPYPSLGEPAVLHQAEVDPEWYAWEAVKKIIQASGRVCRTLDDFGETIILDQAFERLLNTWKHLFPEWWLSALE